MTPEGSRWEDLAFDESGRLVDLNGPVEFVEFGPPAPITWVAVDDVVEPFGRRSAVMNSRGPQYDLRVVSDVFEDAGGRYVHVAGEDQWWAWVAEPDRARPDRPSRAVCWPSRYVWVEARGGVADDSGAST